VQKIYYGITIRAGDPAPQPGTPLYNKHRRYILTGVIGTYLLYKIYEADWNLQREPDFYQTLNVAFDASTQKVQSAARHKYVPAGSTFKACILMTYLRMAKHHTDKSMGDAFEYIRAQRARDALADPVKRFAYDRFGPDILQWKGCFTVRDYVVQGLQQLVPGYIGSIIGMVIAQFLGRFPHGTYVRTTFKAWHAFETDKRSSGTTSPLSPYSSSN
jgi:hypothetical protein